MIQIARGFARCFCQGIADFGNCRRNFRRFIDCGICLPNRHECLDDNREDAKPVTYLFSGENLSHLERNPTFFNNRDR